MALPSTLPRAALASFPLALLLPLAGAVADFSGGSWTTEGTFTRVLPGHRASGPAALQVAFVDGTAFSIETPDGLVLTGPLTPVGTKGTAAKGELDASSLADLVATMEPEFESATGEEWTAVSGTGTVKARFSKGGARLSVKLKLSVTAVRAVSGKSSRARESYSTRTPDG